MAIRLGVIGLGIGEHHAREYLKLEGVQVVAVADIACERAQQVARRYGIAHAYTSGPQMLGNEKLDAVSICTTPRSHHELVLAAAEHGLHILCEKPMAPSLAECDDMIAACKRAGVTLLLGFKKRSSPAFRFLKDKEGEWGQPRIGQVRFQLGPVPKQWFWDENDGGGPLIENTAHAFDMLRFLFGEAERVYAEGGSYFADGRESISAAACSLRFRSGSIATLAAGAGGIWGYDASERWVLNYDTLNAELEGPFDVPRRLRLMRRDGQAVEERWWQDASGWAEQMRHFLACVRGEASPRATGEDGKRALQLGLAVKQSVREGRPITIDLGQ